MEYNKQERLPLWDKPSDFLLECNKKVDFLIEESRQCLRNRDTVAYHQALIDKALFITDMPELAEDVRAAGLDLPDSVIDLLDNLSDEAWEAIEHAATTRDFQRLADVLARKPRDYHKVTNRLEELIHDLQQSEE